MKYPAAANMRREKRSLNHPAGHEPSVYVVLKTRPSNGANLTEIPTFCARMTRNISLEFPSENKVTATRTKWNDAGSAAARVWLCGFEKGDFIVGCLCSNCCRCVS